MIKWRVRVWEGLDNLEEIICNNETEANRKEDELRKRYKDENTYEIIIDSFDPKKPQNSLEDNEGCLFIIVSLLYPANWFT